MKNGYEQIVQNKQMRPGAHLDGISLFADRTSVI